MKHTTKKYYSEKLTGKHKAIKEYIKFILSCNNSFKNNHIIQENEKIYSSFTKSIHDLNKLELIKNKLLSLLETYPEKSLEKNIIKILIYKNNNIIKILNNITI